MNVFIYVDNAALQTFIFNEPLSFRVVKSRDFTTNPCPDEIIPE